MKTEYEKMVNGEYYDSLSEEILVHVRRARALCDRLMEQKYDEEEKSRILKELFGSTGEKVAVNPPFTCDHGNHIHVGENFFANYDCTIMDACDVIIGKNCLLGPKVSVFSVGHPVDAQLRNQRLAIAKPVTIGDNVWIGGNAVICPGVKIGNNVVVAAGAVVTKDLPDNVLAGGNPAKIIKRL
ncbi:MAG TPA: sugar O-acetyltransferase [Candidatus Blautia excrementipullorum]|nr:sugar O-acetyltransferase [Candidatus Blautia excrementipullorum]